MRVLIGLIVVGVVAIFLAYQFGGVKSFDPEQQYQNAMATIKPGMSWKKVVADFKAPRKYQTFHKVTETVMGQPVETLEPGPLAQFDEQRLAARIDSGLVKYGFVFEYNISANRAFMVEFDAQGNVVQVSDLPTVSDLLDGKVPGIP